MEPVDVYVWAYLYVERNFGAQTETYLRGKLILSEKRSDKDLTAYFNVLGMQRWEMVAAFQVRNYEKFWFKRREILSADSQSEATDSQ